MRFIAEDTNRGDVKDPLSLNLYTYCQGNPIRLVDIDGHSPRIVGPNLDMSFSEFMSDVISIIPVVGDAKDFHEALTGIDSITGEEISISGRVITLVCAAVPFVPGKAGREFVEGVTKTRYTNPWIQKSTYKYIADKYGKDNAQLFIEAMQKGFVGKDGEEGIKKLSKIETKNGIKYTHEIKVIDKIMGDFRIYGYFDESLGQYFFDWFRRGQH